MNPPAYFMLRVRRDGPLVPAKLWLDDAEPGVPENRLDRGRLSVYPRAEIGGREVDPQRVLDRLGVWRRRGDMPLLPHEVVAALADPAQRTPRPVGHWAYAEPISAGEYQYRVAHLAWTREHHPADPRGFADKPIKPAELPLGDFSREKALVG
jgi:hypothetical protein